MLMSSSGRGGASGPHERSRSVLLVGSAAPATSRTRFNDAAAGLSVSCRFFSTAKGRRYGYLVEQLAPVELVRWEGVGGY